MNRLGTLYFFVLGEYAQAEPLLVEELEASRRILGPEHLDTLVAMNNLSLLYQQQGKHQEAELLLTQAIAGMERTLGKEHPQTLGVTQNLVVRYRDSGRHADTVAAGAKLLATQRSALPPDDPGTAVTLHLLGDSLTKLGRAAEAEPLLRESLAIRAEKFPNSWQPLTSKSILGACLSAQGKHEEAETLLREACQGLMEHRPSAPRQVRELRLPEAIRRLIAHYDSIGRVDDAARWRSELQKLANPAAAEPDQPNP